MLYDRNRNDLVVICLKSVAIGITIGVTIFLIYTFPNNVMNIKINGFLLSLALFHLLEFLSTALFNVTQVDDDSFILNDFELHTANFASIMEYIIHYWLFGGDKVSFISYLALCFMLVGQLFRTLAMYTAQESFNHYIQRDKSENHKLITHGIYLISRHPSYFGFFLWFIGLRLWTNNIIILSIGGYKLWQFFNNRIKFEESLLINFFGENYLEYKSKVGTKIPFIS